MHDGALIWAPGWETLAHRRRLVLGAAVAAGAAAAAWGFTLTLPAGTPRVLAVASTVSFSLLFAWISWGTWTAVAGFLVLWRAARHPRRSDRAPCGSGARGRTAIVYPICDEDTRRVFAGVDATYGSLRETGHAEAFDIYILSDSQDPKRWIDEETAWTRLCLRIHGFGRVYYRRRRAPSGGKAENIAEFCRRWGRRYRYMLVLDADSIMSGATIVRLVDLMEARPGAGIIQTVPVPVNRSSLFARVRQFASRLYGPMAAAGLQYWQCGDGVYWGHNAILRVEPFMASCGLPRLPGPPPLGGQIMSHDFIEAALIRKAGWEVWLACDLDGSYEELPPTLPDHLTRDRRWCRGNLQHGRLLGLPGLSLAHRVHLFLGICAYAVAPLWALFLLSETALGVAGSPLALTSSHMTPSSGQAEGQLLLLASTAAMLLVPKVLALVLVLGRPESAQLFGGPMRCLAGAVLELCFSVLVAPILMLSHAWFVISILAGRRVRWTSQRRHDYALTWKEAWRSQAGVTALGLAWAAAIAATRSLPMLAWLLPALAGLMLAIPISVVSSNTGLGGAARRRLFVTPEEVAPPPVLREFRRALDRDSGPPLVTPGHGDVLAQVVIDPYANASHIWQLLFQPQDGPAADSVFEKALRGDPGRLAADEKAALLDDPDALANLHLEFWSAPEETARRWRRFCAAARQEPSST